MKETRNLFGKRLREARLATGLTQKQCGIAAGLDGQAASARMAQYERGIHTPSFETAERLAHVLGVPAAFFYARDDDLAAIIRMAGRFGRRARRRLLVSLGARNGI